MAGYTIVHLSDLHIGLRQTERTRTVKIFEKLASAHPGVPVIITGDLTDSATRTQFTQARKLLEDLAKTNPVLTVPGNHDYAWKGNILREDGWENWMEYLGCPLGWGRKEVPWMGVDQEPQGIDGLGVWEHGPCVYFGIDSGDPKDKQISARGFISKGLADALQTYLDKYRGRTRVALLHHHPFTEGFFTKLYGSQRLLRALKTRCELLLFGHHHEYGIWWNRPGLPLVVSSHKSTDAVSGDCLMITIIELGKAGTPHVSFSHRLEVLQ